MKIKLNSKELLERIQYLSAVVTLNNALPILESFLFQFVDQEMKITASDLDTTMTAKMKFEGEGLKNIAVPSRVLVEILKALPSQPIELIIEENSTLKIISASGDYTIAFNDAAEYPQPKAVENPSTITLPTEVLERAIRKTVFACGNDDLRPVMSAVLFQMKTDSITFVATDAHRLVKYKRNDVFSSEEVDFVVPKKPLNVLKSVLEKTTEESLEIQHNGFNASFSFGDYEIKTRLVDAKYPNYEAVIPKENPNQFSVDQSELVNSLKRVSIFSDKTTHQIAIKQNANELSLVAEDINYSTNGKETISCEQINGSIEIGFNARFLSDALNNIDDARAIIETSVPNRAGIVKPENQEEGEELLMLVMPVMLNK